MPKNAIASRSGGGRRSPEQADIAGRAAAPRAGSAGRPPGREGDLLEDTGWRTRRRARAAAGRSSAARSPRRSRAGGDGRQWSRSVGAQGQRRDEHADEPIAVDQLGHPVGQQGQADGDEAVPALGDAGAGTRAEQQPGGEPPGATSRRRRPAASFHTTSTASHSRNHGPGAPACRASATARLTNGKASPSLRPASDVSTNRTRGPSPSPGPADLDGGGKHGIGRRQRRPEQQRRGERQTQHAPADQRRSPAIDNGMAMLSSRQVAAQRRQPIGVSSLRPAPVRETITRNSVARSVSSGKFGGSGSELAGIQRCPRGRRAAGRSSAPRAAARGSATAAPPRPASRRRERTGSGCRDPDLQAAHARHRTTRCGKITVWPDGSTCLLARPRSSGGLDP